MNTVFMQHCMYVITQHYVVSEALATMLTLRIQIETQSRLQSASH